jgi:serine/threonine protein kinase
VAQPAAGISGSERRVDRRPDGLLERLASGRSRATPASPFVGGAPLPIGTRLGNFEVVGVVHRDASGIVYAAEDRSLLGKVAIKEYLPAMLADRMANGRVGVRSLRYKQSFQDGKQRFLSNARLLAALDEPALIRVLRCWKQHGTAYLAMPLYEGRTLNDVLRDSPKPSEAWLKTMLGPLLDALATLHRFDCLPCNVTPDNIVVLQDGTPLLFAFGAGRLAAPSTTGDAEAGTQPRICTDRTIR